MTDEQIDAVIDVQWGRGCMPNQYLAHRCFARAILSAAAPEIRRQERERCAKLVDKRELRALSIGRIAELQDCADAIRSMPDAE